MVEIMDWTQTHVHHTMFICWGSQAALHHFHGARRYRMEKKAFGVFPHKVVNPRSHFLRGFSDSPVIPVSRYNDIDRTSLGKDLEILIDNEEIGVCCIDDPKHRAVHMLNHLEYDNRSLADEYFRDVKAGLNTPLPLNLFPDGDTNQEPENHWRSHAHLLFQNWINEIYQTTPYDLADIGK
jgi:homoserine O-succinyltransferase